MNKTVYHPLLVSIALFFLYFLISYPPLIRFLESDKNHLLQDEILQFEQKSVSDYTIDSLKKLNFETITYSYLGRKKKSLDFIQVYNKDSIAPIFWDKKSMALKPEIRNELDSHITLYKINNEYFLIKSEIYQQNQIVFWFQLEEYISRKLKSKFHFFESNRERKEYNILDYSSSQDYNYVDSKHNFLFSLHKTNYSNDLWIFLGIVFIILSIVSFFKSIFHFFKRIAALYPILGCTLFLVFVYLLRKICLYFKFPALLYSLKLFNPSLYHSDVTPSLGDLFLFIMTTQISILFIKNNLKINMNTFNKLRLGFIIHTAALVFLLGEAFSINKIFERMVVESSIWFNFNYFPRLTLYSFIGLAIMLLSFTNYYLLSNYILKKTVELKLNKTQIIASFMSVLAIIVYASIFSNLKLEIKISFYFLILLLVISYSKYYFKYQSRIFNNLLFLFFATTCTTFLLYRNNIKKEELILSSISSNLAFGKDKNIERELISYFQCSSNYTQKLCSIDSLQTKFTIQQIDALDYQNSGYFEENKSFSKKLPIYRDSILTIDLIKSENDNHYIIKQNKFKTKYFSVYPKNVLNNISTSTKKAINEIIIRDNTISYAIYQNGILEENSGVFPYTEKYTFKNSKGKMVQNAFNSNFEHSIFPINKNTTIVVSTNETDTVSIFTQFSYIFCFNILLLFTFKFLGYIIYFDAKTSWALKPHNLQTKIVSAIFLIIVSIFVSIAYLSYGSLNSKFNEYHRDVLLNNLNISQIALSSVFQSNHENMSAILDYVDKLSKNLIQINIFNNQGILINAQQNESTELLDPSLLWKLKFQNNKLYEIHSENILFNKYEALTNIKSKSNQDYYISIMSEESENNRSDVTKLIIALLNLYILLFLVSMAFAFWLAKQITKPLQLLTERISNIQLSKQNEYLEYKYQDEIGELVKKYNKLIDELDNSAKMLAYHERETAWAEMAKQIAHEIKNPLTPMKLKIQYLQKKIDHNSPDILQFTSDTAITLIEQIENLDNIATSFSNFAKLHNPRIESLDWVKMIRNVANMFETSILTIHFKTKIKEALISCDQNQMTSCLNNIIKNAIQSYSEESGIIDMILTENNTFYILKIQDYGRGIEAEHIDKIFMPNFTTKSSGTGLGLAITKKIIESFSGEITFESVVNEGTVFQIAIPKIKATNEITYTPAEKNWLEKKLCPVHHDNVKIDLVYTTSDNPFQTILYTDFDKAFLHEIAYQKVLKGIEILSRDYPHLKLIIKDALRPYAIQKRMWDSYQGIDKSKFIANPELDSMHNYGMAIDVWLCHSSNSPFEQDIELDFGCHFDEFSDRAHIHYNEITDEQRANRMILQKVMKLAGFTVYENEFWHFEAMDKTWTRTNCERF